LIASLKEGEAREARAMAGGALRLRAEEGRWRLGVKLVGGARVAVGERGGKGRWAGGGEMGRKEVGRQRRWVAGDKEKKKKKAARGEK
jgi:hypothetical protein